MVESTEDGTHSDACVTFASLSSDRPAGGTADRIQKLRKEYHQARREGLPFYDEEEGRGRPADYDQHWVGAWMEVQQQAHIQH